MIKWSHFIEEGEFCVTVSAEDDEIVIRSYLKDEYESTATFSIKQTEEYLELLRKLVNNKSNNLLVIYRYYSIEDKDWIRHKVYLKNDKLILNYHYETEDDILGICDFNLEFEPYKLFTLVKLLESAIEYSEKEF